MKNSIFSLFFFCLLVSFSARASERLIKATFIQPYLVEQWDDSRWKQEFKSLKAAGMEYVIFMHTVHTDQEGNTTAVYPSALPGVSGNKSDLLENCLRNARRAGFKVFVGLNFNEAWWKADFTPQWLMQQMEFGNQVAEELIGRYKSRYKDTMYGWYWVWEVDNSYCKTPMHREFLVKALNMNLDYLHQQTKGMPFLLSPFMNSQNGTAAQCAEMWKYVLTNAHFQDGDIFAPQDCIGSGFLNLDEVADWFSALADVIPTTPRIRFVANVEMFDQRFWTTATLDRIQRQMDLLSPYVSGFICFAYSHYYSPWLRHPAFHEAYTYYAQKGCLPFLVTPLPVSQLAWMQNEKQGVFLSWKDESKPQAVGYHIYREGQLVGDVQRKKEEAEPFGMFTVREAGTYEVAAYNVCGAESVKTQVTVPDYLFGQRICGRVTCQGKGIAGVVVTDGFDCVATDGQGRYELKRNRGARFVYISSPAGYLVPVSEQTIPQFYLPLDSLKEKDYDFELLKNPKDDNRHTFLVQADVQATSEKDIAGYRAYLQDVQELLRTSDGQSEVFGIDCGDIVGDSPQLFPSYIQASSTLNIPVYRAIGNHDMTYGGRTFEYSYRTFEDYFGPIYYSFNRGKAHYIVLDNCFYVNRDYQYIGYIDERTFAWLEQDLRFVAKGSPVFVVVHIPTSLTPKLQWNALLQDETSNASGLYRMLEGYDAHIISGHTHFNLNVCFNDSLMEHNTAAVCGIWWKADICMDGTPAGYGVYEVDGTDVKWYYKSAGQSKDYQFRAYPVGASREYPKDIIANVWNWDEKWKVEWYEDGKRMGEMTRFTGYDPDAEAICSDKERVQYDWISPVQTSHLFRATPRSKTSKVEIKVTDRFGNVFSQLLK